MPVAGTGQHPLSVASSYDNVEVIAVELSRASLAYGKRMGAHRQEIEAPIYTFAGADIVRLDSTGPVSIGASALYGLTPKHETARCETPSLAALLLDDTRKDSQFEIEAGPRNHFCHNWLAVSI